VNFIINNIFLISIILVSGFLLLLPTLQGRGPHIPPYTVTKKMNEGKVQILDVSSQEEYDAGHIRNAVHIPFEELKDRAARIERYKNDTVVIVCPTGTRAAKATSVLKKLGFKDVSSMEGGMKDWKSQNMPVEATEVVAEKDKAKGKRGKA